MGLFKFFYFYFYFYFYFQALAHSGPRSSVLLSVLLGRCIGAAAAADGSVIDDGVRRTLVAPLKFFCFFVSLLVGHRHRDALSTILDLSGATMLGVYLLLQHGRCTLVLKLLGVRDIVTPLQ